MAMRKIETQFYTREQVEDHLDVALDILEARDLEAETHGALLVAVFEKLANKNIQLEQVIPGNGLMQIPRGL